MFVFRVFTTLPLGAGGEIIARDPFPGEIRPKILIRHRP
jgi:hypothetical protein